MKNKFRATRELILWNRNIQLQTQHKVGGEIRQRERVKNICWGKNEFQKIFQPGVKERKQTYNLTTIWANQMLSTEFLHKLTEFLCKVLILSTFQCDRSGDWVFEEVGEVSTCGWSPNAVWLISLLEEEEMPEMHGHRVKTMWGHRDKATKATKGFGVNQTCWSLDLEFTALKLWEDTCLLFKPNSLWYFIMAVLAD